MLETLFVELKNPPSEIQIDGLPINIVPLTCTSNSMCCYLPDDSKIQITRTQVEVLPNFAMTDYASQGKTRPNNPVDLGNCRSHQAYYTALSRSATAAGTVILQNFDPRKITGRASGALRQEFRDLELLDEITKLQYESKLHETVAGSRRSTLIHAYRQIKGLNYVPPAVHHSIAWNAKDPMLDPINEETMDWKMKDKTKEINSKKLIKRKVREIEEQEVEQQGKKRKYTANSGHQKPHGLSWYQNSCAYDATLTIIHAIWCENAAHWTHVFSAMNRDLLASVMQDFTKNQNGMLSLEAARDNLRQKVMQNNSVKLLSSILASPWI